MSTQILFIITQCNKRQTTKIESYRHFGGELDPERVVWWHSARSFVSKKL